MCYPYKCVKAFQSRQFLKAHQVLNCLGVLRFWDVQLSMYNKWYLTDPEEGELLNQTVFLHLWN